MNYNQYISLILIGIISGAITGFFGLAGGLIIIPALVYLAGFSQQTAVGTNLFVLLLPVSIASVMEYYRNGHVDVKAGIIIAITLLISAWICSKIALKINTTYLRFAFGLFVIVMGVYITWTSFIKLSR